jgi:hypothetical protein
MRAKEFTINIPICITVNSDGEPVVNTPQTSDDDFDSNPVFVPPLQQHLELTKASLGKESPVIDKLTAPENIGSEEDNLLARIKQLLAKRTQ